MAEIPTDYETDAGDRHDQLRLWLRLLSCTYLIENEIRSRLLQSFDTTLPRFDLMAQLDRVPEGLTMGALSARLMVSNGNTTGIVERLVAEGLVKRTVSNADRRSTTVSLTAKGRNAFKVMATQHESWIRELFTEIDPATTKRLLTLLGETKDAVRKSLAAPRAAAAPAATPRRKKSAKS
ncbi:MarR family winged helix-turn-helix transcriptional regulator [Roseiterribacter gracilis]|uniref:Transcriptional regulator n=1 Tax=Roseiterribacter gracilis TaxID=2812848 RepID=A0A8S8XC85_9PROT|nr:transcriptional regulator [Rhodospirillales bacterium TMPK1]